MTNRNRGTSNRALVVGESLVDVIRRSGSPAMTVPGGSPLNVAIGLRRLGIRVAFQSRFGLDANGELIRAHLLSNDVEITPGTQQSGTTSVADAVIGSDGAASYEFHINWDTTPDRHTQADVSFLHTGSIAALLEPGASVVEEQVRLLRRTATISFDPNIRPQLAGPPAEARRRLAGFITNADIIKASDEDVTWLHPDQDAEAVARTWLEMGPSLVVVTRGSAGAFALTRAGIVDSSDAPAVNVVDTVGAGDAFMAGILAALADRNLLGRQRGPSLREISVASTREVIDFAVQCAAITVSRPGADPPTRDELSGIHRATTTVRRSDRVTVHAQDDPSER